MSGDTSAIANLLAARAEFYERAVPSAAYCRYVREHEFDLDRMVGFAGATGVVDVADCGGGRFDWAAAGERFPAFICEAIAADGETINDLVAWPINEPNRVFSMFGRAAWLGAWAVWNPSTYYLGKPLEIHRNPLGWLQAGCTGAAVVCQQLAARDLIDLPGPIAAQDRVHARTLVALARGITSRTQILVRRRVRDPA